MTAAVTEILNTKEWKRERERESGSHKPSKNQIQIIARRREKELKIIENPYGIV